MPPQTLVELDLDFYSAGKENSHTVFLVFLNYIKTPFSQLDLDLARPCQYSLFYATWHFDILQNIYSDTCVSYTINNEDSCLKNGGKERLHIPWFESFNIHQRLNYPLLLKYKTKDNENSTIGSYLIHPSRVINSTNTWWA